MSFSQEIKSGLVTLSGGLRHECCKRCELYGVLFGAGIFSKEKIKLVTTSEALAELVIKRLSDTYGIKANLYITDRKSGEAEERRNCKITVVQRGELEKLFRSFRYGDETPVTEISTEIMKCQGCRSAFVRGVYMAAGTVSAPEKGYHLELDFLNKPSADNLAAFLSEAGIPPKAMKRKNEFVLYYKDSDSIESFLAFIGATTAAFTIMNKKIERELRSDANRRANSELANITKTVSAAGDRIGAIKSLKKKGFFDKMPDELVQTAQIQLENPEATLSQLAGLHIPPITKSGVNHRLKKIMELASRN